MRGLLPRQYGKKAFSCSHLVVNYIIFYVIQHIECVVFGTRVLNVKILHAGKVTETEERYET